MAMGKSLSSDPKMVFTWSDLSKPFWGIIWSQWRRLGPQTLIIAKNAGTRWELEGRALVDARETSPAKRYIYLPYSIRK
jgi:hypothetical protein